MTATPTLSFRLSHAVESTPPPPIALAKAWGLAYRASPTKPLIDLSQGAPGVPPPPELLRAIGEASRDPASCGYGPMNGEPAMRKALAEEMKVVYPGADIQDEDVSLTAGCNMSFLAVAMALAEPGDEVILPIPWYFNHQMSLQMLGITAVPLPCVASHGFIPSVPDCAKLITPRTRAIVLVTPNNPTGAIYSPELLASFASLSKEHNIALVMDETYRDLIPSGAPHNLFSPRNGWEWRTNLVHMFSFSKSYCVPGHRLGAIVASPTLLNAVNTVLDCMQICPPRPIQLALAPLLPRLRPFIRATTESLRRRHSIFRTIMPREWEIGSQGGYYAFVRHPFAGRSATEVSMRLAKELGVVLLPATFFFFEQGKGQGQGGGGGESEDGSRDRWMRVSVANVDEEELGEAGERLRGCGKVFGWSMECCG